jgi:hypothetical protein
VCLIDPALFALPARDELPRLDRGECAIEIDSSLRRLARHEAQCRFAFGRIARVFLVRDAHRHLGFARVGDYTRERFGWSAREMQDAARVVAGLDVLPELRAAFTEGSLSWTKMRLLVAVATPATEIYWLREAAGRTARALEARSKRWREAAVAGGEAAPSSPCAGPAQARLPPSCADLDDDGDTIDGEAIVRFKLRCPRRVRVLWRYVVELAERMSGARLPAWRAAETIAAEGMSAVPRAPGAPVATGSEGGEIADSAAATTVVADSEETYTDYAWLDWSAVAAVLPIDVAEASHDDASADPERLDARLRAVVRSMRSIDWQMGRLLRLFFDLRLHTVVGFPSQSRYVRERLGISSRKARMLVALERQTWRVPALLDPYRRGDVSVLQALTLAPVLDAAVATAWLERARILTLRRLNDEVGWALDVRDAAMRWEPVAPPPLDSTLPWAPRQMRAPGSWEECDAEVTFVGPASVVALFRNTIAAFTRPGTREWQGLARLLDHARQEWESQPRHRDPIFARDGWRCAIPACSARRSLHDHHVHFRSHGGTNAQDNRVAVCAAHHLYGIHRGTVRATGRAPDAIHWQLGFRRGRGAFLDLLGDRYLSADVSPRCRGTSSASAS